MPDQPLSALSGSIRGHRSSLVTPDGGRIPVNPLREVQHWVVDSETGCWNWTGTQYKGYGRHRLGAAHRVVYRQFGNQIPEGFDLHHKCENKACVNPEHMEPRDKVDHEREHWKTRGPFSQETIAELKQFSLENPRVTTAELGRMFGMQAESARNIVNGRTWREEGESRTSVLVCDVCGESFTHKRRQSRYCSQECKREANRKRPSPALDQRQHDE